MTNTIAESFYRWEVAGKPVAVLFDLDLIDRLEREVLESFKAVTRRGSEIGGVLGGRVIAGSPPTVVIERFEPVECDYSRGPLYLLSDADRVRMKQALARIAGGGMSVAGFFRSNTRRALVLDEEDQALAKEFFSGPNQVCLLVRPFAMKPSAGGFFFWENGQLQEATCLEFPFKRSELVKRFAEFIVAPPETAFAAPKPEEPAPAPPPSAVRREEPKASPAPQPPPAPAATARREERSPVVAAPNGKPAPPPIAVRTAEPAAAARREERPPLAAAPNGKPAPPPIVARRAEPTPAQPAEKQGVSKPVKAAPPEAEPTGVAPLKARPVVAPEPPVPTELSAAAAQARQPSPISRFKSVIVALALVMGAGAAYYGFVRQGGPRAGQAQAADTALGLRLDNNGGQLYLTWNRNAPLVSSATRATLTINDGDHKEDVDLDLATLRSGSIVYSPISNDASFRLEVTDRKTGMTQASSVRRLAGQAVPVAAATYGPQVAPQTAVPAPGANEQPATAAVQQAPAPPQQPPPVAQIVATAPVTVQPAKENSLAARLRAGAPPEIPAAPALESQPNTFAGSAPNMPGATSLAPPPAAPVVQQPPRAATPAPPAATPSAGAAIGGRTQGASVLKQFPVAYPADAKRGHITGSVRVLAVVGKDGRVKKATAVSGPMQLRHTAENSVMRWIYSPALQNGTPVEAETQVDLNFSGRM